MGPIVDPSQPIGRVTTTDESLQQEVRSAKACLLWPKTKIRLGAWNVRTMYETSKLAQVVSEMRRYKLDILGISECYWTRSGRHTINDGSVILHSGHKDNTVMVWL
ncbi:craniofacial development protein 2-like [Xyrichtys novacula]|uniref:Craniofacial development protein 2-like n=1 Tax=Xyrichtys novacula TaxID=13765 RepID=A0AAV1HN52_XYRNO|nr:craniofacial development protein 2-like [Xyrichtys novacula]